MSDYIDLMEANRGEPVGALPSVIAAMQRQEHDEETRRQQATSLAEARAEAQRTARFVAGLTPDAITRAREEYGAAADRVAELRAELERAERVLRSADARRREVLERMDAASGMASRSEPDLVVASAQVQRMSPIDRYLERRQDERVTARVRRMQAEAFAKAKDQAASFALGA